MKKRESLPLSPGAFGNLHRALPSPALPTYAPPPVRTLDDMTPDEVAAIEQQYGCRVMQAPQRHDRDRAATLAKWASEQCGRVGGMMRPKVKRKK